MDTCVASIKVGCKYRHKAVGISINKGVLLLFKYIWRKYEAAYFSFEINCAISE